MVKVSTDQKVHPQPFQMLGAERFLWNLLFLPGPIPVISELQVCVDELNLEHFRLWCCPVRIPLKQDTKCFPDIVVAVAAAPLLRTHHNTGRCSQILSRLPPEAHRLLVLFENSVLDSDVFELGGENPTDAILSAVDNWLNHEHIHPLRSLCFVLVNSKMQFHLFHVFLFLLHSAKSQKSNTDMSNLICLVCSHVPWLSSVIQISCCN